jgi:hypothetical protein
MKLRRNVERGRRRWIGVLVLAGVGMLGAAGCTPGVGSAPAAPAGGSGTPHLLVTPTTVSIDSHATGTGPIPAGPGYGTAQVEIKNDGTAGAGPVAVSMDNPSGTGTWSASLTFGYCSNGVAVGGTCQATIKYFNNTASGTGTATFTASDGTVSATASATGHGVA